MGFSACKEGYNFDLRERDALNKVMPRVLAFNSVVPLFLLQFHIYMPEIEEPVRNSYYTTNGGNEFRLVSGAFPFISGHVCVSFKYKIDKPIRSSSITAYGANFGNSSDIGSKITDGWVLKKFSFTPNGHFSMKSDYERLRKNNIEEKRKMLELMNFQELKEDLYQLTAKKKQARHLKKPKSLRLQGINPDLAVTSVTSTLNFEKVLRDGDDMQLSENFINQLKSASYDQKIGEDWSNPVLSKVKNKFESLQLQEKNVAKVVPNRIFGPLGLLHPSATCNPSQKHSCLSAPHGEYLVKNKFESLQLQEKNVAKVVPNRIFSVEIHPSINKLLVFAGDRKGYLGIWDVHAHNSQDGVYVYRPHSQSIYCLKFNKENPHYLYSLGNDRTIKQGDLTKAVFEEIFRIPDDEDYSCSYFDFLSSNSAVVSLTNGMVAVTDFRNKRQIVTNYEIPNAKYSLRTVSVHPTKKQYFITNGIKGTITLWDTRHMKVHNGKPIASLPGHMTTSSSFFSPITGNKILATSYNDKIRHVHRIPPPAMKAVWLPNNEELFVVGSIDRPHRIEILSETGQAFHLFSSDYLDSICSTNSIHPSYNILAGGSSSGLVHLFM
ncbi:WD repeat-containing protein 76 [Nymphon striatum]|nr:WD repeat-containing protein 76 [Nymphon striatum]